MIDVILSCPGGFTVSLTELSQRGYSHILKFDDLGAPVGISEQFNPLYLDEGNFDIPSLVYLRAADELLQPMIEMDWVETNILAWCKTGDDIIGLIRDNPVALAEYLTYPKVQVPALNPDGTENIQYAEFNTVDIEGVPTQVKNPHYQPCLGLGSFSK